MNDQVRIIGLDGEEIHDLAGWFKHAPPAGGEKQWVDGYSAKEQAKAWLRPGRSAVPTELAHALAAAGFGHGPYTAFPEQQTRLDDLARGDRGKRNHDMLLLLGDPDDPTAVVGIEAKAAEGFDGTVADKLATPAPTKLPDRCDLLARALFGRPVRFEEEGEVDHELERHGYQLWTAAVGTAIEAQSRGSREAIVLIHQFAPGTEESPAGDKRQWDTKLASNGEMIYEFKLALAPEPVTFETEFVRPGTPLHVLTVCTLMDGPPDGQGALAAT